MKRIGLIRNRDFVGSNLRCQATGGERTSAAALRRMRGEQSVGKSQKYGRARFTAENGQEWSILVIRPLGW